MKQKTALLILLFACGFTCLQAQVSVPPYTVGLFTVTSTGAKGTAITLNSQLQENTVYYVEVNTSTSGSIVAGLLCRLFNGFEAGRWDNGFVPYDDPEVAQGDGDFLAFRIRTFSDWDFVTPLSMRVYECHYQVGSCANPGGAGWQNQRLVEFPEETLLP